MNPDSKPDQPAQGQTPAPDPVRDSGPGATRTTLGKYKLGQRLGAGGMGWVYLAFDTERKCSVALKVLPRSKAANPVLVQRFKAEAKAASQLSHRNIVHILEAGEADGYLYMALEYFKGTDVHHLVARLGVLPVRRSIEMIRQMAGALDQAFEKAIVHRDIKPSNLLVSRDGTVKLADFGLARSIDETDDSSLTRAGTTVGTVDYMAPEQARNSRAADIRSDIYSLGCTWYHMLTGEPPFPNGTLTNKLFAHVSSARPDPRAKNPLVPAGVVEVMHKMMARKPRDRYQTPAELLDALDNIADVGIDIASAADFANANFETTLNDVVGRETASEIPAMSSTPSAVRMPVRRRRATRHGSIWDYIHGGHIAVGVVAVAIFAVLYWALIHFGNTQGDVILGPPAADTRAEANSAALAPVIQTPDQPKPVQPEAKPQPTSEPVAVVRPKPAPSPPSPNETRPSAPGKAPTVPGWTETIWPAGGAQQPPVVTVGRDDGGPAQFADLADALSNVPKEGRTVQLIGNGPFVLPPLQLAGVSKIALKGEPNARPIVMCIGLGSPRVDSILRVDGGTLVFDNIHVVFAGESFDASHPVVLADVSGGDLVVRDCSITLDRPRNAAVTAFRVSGSMRSGAAPKVLFERTFFRGDPLSPFSVADSPVDLVARECLFATGRAPVVQAVGGGASDGQAARVFRFYSCTATVQQTMFQFIRGADAAWRETVLECRNSLFAVQSGESDGVLLSLVDFPQAAAALGSAHGVRCVADNCAFAGWKDLVRSIPEPRIRVQGPAQWGRFWKMRTDTLEFPSAQWPAAPIRDFAKLQAADLNFKSGGSDNKGGSRVGCDVAMLRMFNDDWLPRAASLVHRPVAPAQAIGRQKPPKTVGIHLADDDLGNIISNTDWPDGTEFVVTGTGSHRSTPVHVQGKSFRIRFDGAARRYAEIVPRPTDEPGSDEAGGAMIFVKNGNIEIDGANFKIPSSSNRASAPCALKVANGSFAIRNSSMLGPSAGTPKFDGLIQWARSGQSQVAAFSGGIYLQHGEIENSFLNAPRPILAADWRGFALSVRNSLLVSLDDVFRVDLSGAGSAIASAFDIEQSTLSAGNCYFNLRFGPVVHRESPSVRVYVAETVFAPPVGPKTTARDAGGPVVVAAPKAAWPEQKLLWWGSRNGYAGEVPAFTRDPAEPAITDRQDFELAWNQMGRPHAEVCSLWQPGDVALKSAAADPAKVVPGDFEIGDSSKAADWSVDGGAIGADLASLTMPDPTAKPETADPADEHRIEGPSAKVKTPPSKTEPVKALPPESDRREQNKRRRRARKN